jgi:hypothetical protein
VELWQLGLIIAPTLAALLAFIWMARQLEKGPAHDPVAISTQVLTPEFVNALKLEAAKRINEVVSGPNSPLHASLQAVSGSIEQLIQHEVSQQLGKELATYQLSITNSKNMVEAAIAQAQTALDEEQKALKTEMREVMQRQKDQLVERFAQDMTEIVSQYVRTALGGQPDAKEQLERVLEQLETHKADIVEDMKHAT